MSGVNAEQTDAERELTELREAVLDDWIVVTTRTAGALAAMHSTLSWRITKPLRLVRIFQRTARERGLGGATELAAVAIARRVGRA